MATVPGGVAASGGSLPPVSMEGKILQAASEAAQVVDIFAPAIGHAIEEGIAFEPMVSGFLHLLVGLFRHHTTKATK